ncbi:MAG TPA: type II toxin-antitoxin system VapC family toxin [Chloroflexia bacterium]
MVASLAEYLLDTNIVIAFFAGDTNVRSQFASADKVSIPSIVLGELYFGAEKSEHVQQNVARADNFARETGVLACDAGTARLYGIITNRLRLKGRPIPYNDVWISAVALQYDQVLVTRDAHFREVQDLKLERW